MLKKILFTLGIAIVMGNYASAQNATIKGKVTESDGKTPVDFATIQLMQGGQLVLGAIADVNGNYTYPTPQGTRYNFPYHPPLYPIPTDPPALASQLQILQEFCRQARLHAP